MRRNDILWKGILQDLFEDFLRFIYPNADEIFDFSKSFEFLDKELEQLFPPTGDAGSVRFVDKLVKVHLIEGGEKWLLVHIEVQAMAIKALLNACFNIIRGYLINTDNRLPPWPYLLMPAKAITPNNIAARYWAPK